MKIVTHSSTYHIDDVFSAAILTAIYPNAEIIRTRDPVEIEKADIAFDVGGGKFDHHFEGAEKRPNGITYSSCGLIWREYGHEFLLIQEVPIRLIDDVWKYWDSLLIEIDANDNGECEEGRVSDFHLASVVGSLNINTDFVDVVAFIRKYICAKTKNMTQYHIDRMVIRDACEAQKNKQIIELPYRLFWQSSIAEFAPQALFVIFPEKHQWRISAVPVSPGSFVSKCPILEAYRGIPKPKLRKMSGLELNFVHASGFTGAADTRTDVLELAVRSIAENE